MNVGRGEDDVMVIVLDVNQFGGQLSLMMTVDQRDGTSCFLVFFPFLRVARHPRLPTYPQNNRSGGSCWLVLVRSLVALWVPCGKAAREATP